MSRIPSLKYLTLLKVWKQMKDPKVHRQIFRLPDDLLQILARGHKIKSTYFSLYVDIDNNVPSSVHEELTEDNPGTNYSVQFVQSTINSYREAKTLFFQYLL